MLLKCQKAAVRRTLRDRNPFSTFEIFEHTRYTGIDAFKVAAPARWSDSETLTACQMLEIHSRRNKPDALPNRCTG